MNDHQIKGLMFSVVALLVLLISWGMLSTVINHGWKVGDAFGAMAIFDVLVLIILGLGIVRPSS